MCLTDGRFRAEDVLKIEHTMACLSRAFKTFCREVRTYLFVYELLELRPKIPRASATTRFCLVFKLETGISAWAP
jgi:hypothetical protein